MSFKLKDGEKIGRGIRKTARREIDAIIEHLAGRHFEAEGKSVHEARKHLKKTRALLRLIRDELGDRIYRQENRAFRDVGRVLSPRRDAEVLVKALNNLRCGQSPGVKMALLKLEKVLLGRHQQAFETGDCNQDLGPALKAARRRAGHWPLENLEWSDFICGLRRSYGRGRKALKKVERVRTNENLHEWRKRVKDLLYQLHLVEAVCPKVISKLGEEIEKLGEHLGEDHDLAMLDAMAKSAGLTLKETQGIAHCLEVHRRPLQAAAFDLGRRFYAEKPDRFAQRIRDCSKTGGGG
ncbi:MAG: domain containing protein [Pedosphaera sp.]|nr:domain containing protein [Pedosphaera sp.]